jgi:hypothetical protein
MMNALGFASLSPSERAWLADTLALICLIGIAAALYVAGAV